MLSYDLRLATRSIRRNPGLAALIVGGVAVGIAVASTFVTLRHLTASDPIPSKSDQLFYVRLDSWSGEEAWDSEATNLPPDQVTWRDAEALLESDIPTRSVASFVSTLIVHPEGQSEGKEERPFRESVRLTGADFFPMFEVPFRYGSSWTAAAEAALEPVVVIGSELNQKLFGGDNSVGRTIKVHDRSFRIVGVLDHWRPMPKYFDPHNGGYNPPESIFMPFGLIRPLDLRSNGNISNWRNDSENTLDAIYAGESIWIQFWAELPDAGRRQAFRSYLDAYVNEQKKSGRFPRPLNNRLQPVMEFLEAQEVVPPATQVMQVIALLFLAVSAVNLIGILLGKFLARAPEVGIRRALGASRAAVFRQHLVECELLALAGGLLGLAMATVMAHGVGRMFVGGGDFTLDLPMVAAAIGLALVAGLVAGVYPAWRICRVPPASYLKLQ